jgi:hypothetical protein
MSGHEEDGEERHDHRLTLRGADQSKIFGVLAPIVLDLPEGPLLAAFHQFSSAS